MSTVPVPPTPRRIITTHDAAGKAIIARDIPMTIELHGVPTTQAAALYATTSSPASNSPSSLNSSLESAAARSFIQPNGTKLTILHMAPGAESGMHRTVTVDYIIIISGELELELDSGEKETVRQGDVVVQRGTNHKWRNIGTEWVRFAAVLVDAEKVVTEGGETLDWDLREIMLDTNAQPGPE